MADADLYHPDFKAMPVLVGSLPPDRADPVDLPPRVRVAIVGGWLWRPVDGAGSGQAGDDCVVLEAAELGFGASTRNGGGVSGGVNIGKGYFGKSLDPESDRAHAVWRKVRTCSD